MSLKQVAEFAKSKLGCGYVYGATGWICNASRRRQQANQYPEYADTILSTCKKWDGKQCYDCAQLTRAAVAAVSGSLPSGATSQWNSSSWVEKGEIATLPDDDEGIILYRQKSGTSTMQHTGVDIGGGRVVDSRGSSYGVIESDLTSYAWTHWARPRVSDGNTTDSTRSEESVIRQSIVTKISGATGSTVNLRKSANSGSSVVCTVPFGTAVDILEESGGWSRSIYNSNEGWMMTKFLPTDTTSASEGESYADTVTVSKAKLEALRSEINAMLGD